MNPVNMLPESPGPPCRSQTCAFAAPPGAGEDAGAEDVVRRAAIDELGLDVPGALALALLFTRAVVVDLTAAMDRHTAGGAVEVASDLARDLTITATPCDEHEHGDKNVAHDESSLISARRGAKW
ncbi:hypothetical protein [Sorangium cellulosum]|uniref:hypothetical protein n=1 Tax=Sorangium cellulosum TaxID=56 RepID=UPI0016512D61|nr:hypothetical protein [Sorangium cellulosum]